MSAEPIAPKCGCSPMYSIVNGAAILNERACLYPAAVAVTAKLEADIRQARAIIAEVEEG